MVIVGRKEDEYCESALTLHFSAISVDKYSGSKSRLRGLAGLG